MFALQLLQVLFSEAPEPAAMFKQNCLSAYSIEQALVSLLSNFSPVFQVREFSACVHGCRPLQLPLLASRPLLLCTTKATARSKPAWADHWWHAEESMGMQAEEHGPLPIASLFSQMRGCALLSALSDVGYVTRSPSCGLAGRTC